MDFIRFFSLFRRLSWWARLLWRQISLDLECSSSAKTSQFHGYRCTGYLFEAHGNFAWLHFLPLIGCIHATNGWKAFHWVEKAGCIDTSVFIPSYSTTPESPPTQVSEISRSRKRLFIRQKYYECQLFEIMQSLNACLCLTKQESSCKCTLQNIGPSRVVNWIFIESSC